MPSCSVAVSRRELVLLLCPLYSRLVKVVYPRVTPLVTSSSKLFRSKSCSHTHSHDSRGRLLKVKVKGFAHCF